MEAVGYFGQLFAFPRGIFGDDRPFSVYQPVQVDLVNISQTKEKPAVGKPFGHLVIGHGQLAYTQFFRQLNLGYADNLPQFVKPQPSKLRCRLHLQNHYPMELVHMKFTMIK